MSAPSSADTPVHKRAIITPRGARATPRPANVTPAQPPPTQPTVSVPLSPVIRTPLLPPTPHNIHVKDELHQLIDQNADIFKCLPKHTKLALLQVSKSYFSIVYPLIGPFITECKPAKKFSATYSQTKKVSLLHYYARCGNTTMVKLAVQLGRANVNALTESPLLVPLHYALLRERKETASALVELGTNFRASLDPTNPNLGGPQFLELAVIHGWFSMAKEMVKNGAPINSDDSIHIYGYGVIDVPKMIGRGIDINIEPPEPREISLLTIVETKLMHAVECGTLATIRQILHGGQNPNKLLPVGKTLTSPLHHACAKGNAETVKELVACGADPNLVDAGRTPLVVAVARENILEAAEIVEALLECGADRQKFGPLPIDKKAALPLGVLSKVIQKDKEDATPQLFWAAFLGDAEMVAELLGLGADVNATSQFNITPLHMAVHGGNVDIVTKLLESGANINAEADRGHGTPLHVAIAREKVDVFPVLKKFNADIRIPIKSHTTKHGMRRVPTLVYAKRLGKNKALEHLKKLEWEYHEKNFDANEYNEKRQQVVSLDIDELCKISNLSFQNVDINKMFPNILCTAIRRNAVQFVKNLLKFGVDIKCVEEPSFWGEEKGSQPIHVAAHAKKVKFVRLLVEAGADINARTAHGKTPLHILAQPYVKASKIHKMITLGADIFAKDAEGKTPLHYTRDSYDLESVTELIMMGANKNALDNNGRTPLHSAVYDLTNNLKQRRASLAKDIVDIFVTFRADVNVADKDGYTALHTVAQAGIVGAVKALVAAGADVNARTHENKKPSDVAKAGKYFYKVDNVSFPETIDFLLECEKSTIQQNKSVK